MEIVVFNYDKDHVALHTNAAGSFFFNFIWRFFLINLTISALPLYGLAVMSSDNSNEFPYALMTLVSLLTGYVATLISIWMIRNAKHKDKKSGKTTRLSIKNYNSKVEITSKVWVKVALGYYWRCVLLVMILNLLGFFVFGTVGNHTPLIGFISFFLGWWWFFLFNDKKSIYIDFTVTNETLE